MRITSVESFSVFSPGARPQFAWREGLPGGPDDGYASVLLIKTDEGVEGVAIAPRPGSGPVVSDLVERVLRDELVGADPLQREWLWHRMWELDRVYEFPINVLGLVDTALWDLAGRLYNAPTWEVLGGYRQEIEACASTSTFSTLEEYLDVATQCIELGYPAIKVHAWGDARKDAALCRALREHVGDEYPLMYDVLTSSTQFTLARPCRRRITSGTKSRCVSSISRRTSGSPSEFGCHSTSPRHRTAFT